MKVAHVANSNQLFRKFHRRWVAKLLAAGDSVTWFSEDWGDADLLRSAGVKFVEIPVARDPDPAKLFQYHKRLRQSLWSLMPDVMVTEGTLPAAVARLPTCAPKATKRLHIIHSFPWHDLTPSIVRSSAAIIERAMSRWTDHRIIISREDMAEGLQRRIFRADEVTYAPVGIDLDRYSAPPVPADVEHTRKSLGIRSDQRVILFVGRIVAYKGVFDAADAFRRVMDEFPDHVLVIVGRPDPRPRALREADRLKEVLQSLPPDRYRHVPFVDDLRTVFGLADVFLMPSIYEGLGLVYLEAGAMGVPSIGYNVRGVREAIIHGKTGLLAEPRSVDDLTSSLRSILAQSSLRSTLGAGALEHSKLFSNLDFADKMVKTIHLLGSMRRT